MIIPFCFLGKEPSEEELQAMFANLGMAGGGGSPHQHHRPPHPHSKAYSLTTIISILIVLSIQKPIVGKSILIILVTRWWGSWRSRVAGRFHQPDADDGGDDAEPPLQGPPLPRHEGACRESKQPSSYSFFGILSLTIRSKCCPKSFVD